MRYVLYEFTAFYFVNSIFFRTFASRKGDKEMKKIGLFLVIMLVIFVPINLMLNGGIYTFIKPFAPIVRLIMLGMWVWLILYLIIKFFKK